MWQAMGRSCATGPRSSNRGKAEGAASSRCPFQNSNLIMVGGGRKPRIMKVSPFLAIAMTSSLLGCTGFLDVFDLGPDSGQLAAEAFSVGDFSTAISLWAPLANRGDPVAQFNLGFMLEEGNGTPKDYQGAAQLYRLSANQGYSSAQYNLGKLYQEGLGLARDTVLAAQWYVLAARQGEALAQISLGFLFVNDPAVTCASVIPRDCVAMFGEDPDPALGAIWYRLIDRNFLSLASFQERRLSAPRGLGCCRNRFPGHY